MKFLLKLSLLFALFLLISACAVHGLYYLGLHGPSIKLSPDVHEGFGEDAECLDCHQPDGDPAAPQTTHAGFHGCLKCHNDEIREKTGRS